MSDTDEYRIKLITSIVKKFGYPGTILMFLGFVFLFVFSEEQKHNFIDKYILFEPGPGQHIYCSLALIGLIVVIVIISVFYNKDMNLKKTENNRIGKEKTELMNKLLGQNLSSSD